MPSAERSSQGRLAARPPFHLEATVRVLQRRATNLVDVWDQGCYLRVLPTGDGAALVGVENRGTVDNPDVRLDVLRANPSSSARAALVRTVRKVLGLDVDPEPLSRLAEVEPGLGRTALALRGMRPPRFAELFESFASVVPFQQVSLDSGVAVVGRLVERFGTSLEYEGRRFHAFPSARAVAGAPDGALRACGMSARKAETLRRVAHAIESGEVTEAKLARMNSQDAIRFLDEFKGIGPWSASLVLLRGLGRLDVFPPGDAGAVRGLVGLLGLEPGPSLARVVERLGDRRGYLYFCSLGSSLLNKGLIRAAPTPRRTRSRRRVASPATARSRGRERRLRERPGGRLSGSVLGSLEGARSKR
jgi:3-methyladenine DNA glycosylase/8-oxoguanine DNA glycosylase